MICILSSTAVTRADAAMYRDNDANSTDTRARLETQIPKRQ